MSKAAETRDRIRDYINDNLSNGGVRPRHVDVAEALGVSRPWVSEIIRVLDSEGQLKGRSPAVREPGELTARDAETLQLICEWITEHGWAPSIREVGQALGVGVSTAHVRVQRLVQAGRIETGPDPRQLKVVGSHVVMPEEEK